MSQVNPFDYRGADGAAYHLRRELPLEAQNWVAKVRMEKIQPHVKETDAIFEFGVGFGWNLSALRCASKVGFDVAPGLRSSVLSHGIKFVDDVDLVPREAFDVVLCHHTLEHLKDPAAALEIMRQLLKAGGKLLLFVPFEIERKYRTFNPKDKAHHLYSWTPASLSNLVTAQGFQIVSVQVRKFRFDRIAAVAARKVGLGQKTYRLIRAAGLMLVPEYEIAVVAAK